MALSNLALFGGAFFTPVSIYDLGGSVRSTTNIRLGDSWKDHSHYRFVVSSGNSATSDDVDFALQ